MEYVLTVIAPRDHDDKPALQLNSPFPRHTREILPENRNIAD